MTTNQLNFQYEGSTVIAYFALHDPERGKIEMTLGYVHGHIK